MFKTNGFLRKPFKVTARPKPSLIIFRVGKCRERERERERERKRERERELVLVHFTRY